MKNYFFNKLFLSNPIKDTIIYKGFVKLLGDFKVALIGLTAVVVIVLAMIQVVGYLKAGDDESEKKARKKSAIGIITGGVIILCLEGLVTVIFSYFL